MRTLTRPSCLFISALVFLAGCAEAPRYYWELRPGADFKPLKTYAFEKNEQPLLKNREDLLGIPMRAILERAIESQLSAKGFSKATPPDFIVRYAMGVDQSLNDGRSGRTSHDLRHGLAEGDNPYIPLDSGAARSNVYATRQGSLVIEILDAKTQKGLWRGTFEQAIADGLSDEQREARLNAGIAALLKRFPPN